MRNKNTVKLAILAVLVVSLGFWTFAQAQFNNEGMKLNLRVQQESDIEDGQNSTENRRSGQIVAIKRLVSNQVDRATKLVTRLSGVLDRIESRRDKMSEDGIDVAQIDQLIESAQTQETDTLEALEELKKSWADVELNTEDPRPTVKSFMSAMNAFKREVISFHKNLRETVQAMKRANAAAMADDAENADDDSDTDNQDSDDSN